MALIRNTKRREKKYWTMVFNRIAVHMQQFGQIRATSKNGLKFDISQLCSQPFNYNYTLHSVKCTVQVIIVL